MGASPTLDLLPKCARDILSKNRDLTGVSMSGLVGSLHLKFPRLGLFSHKASVSLDVFTESP